MQYRVFFSYQYLADKSRADQIRTIVARKGIDAVSDDDLDIVEPGSDEAIRNRIDERMRGRCCTVVLVGENTAGRRWVNYEIIKSWNDGMGVVGLFVEGLENRDGQESGAGELPFSEFWCDGRFRLRSMRDHPVLGVESYGSFRLSTFVKCYYPRGLSSNMGYEWIGENLDFMIEEAIETREAYPHLKCRLGSSSDRDQQVR